MCIHDVCRGLFELPFFAFFHSSITVNNTPISLDVGAQEPYNLMWEAAPSTTEGIKWICAHPINLMSLATRHIPHTPFNTSNTYTHTHATFIHTQHLSIHTICTIYKHISTLLPLYIISLSLPILTSLIYKVRTTGAS